MATATNHDIASQLDEIAGLLAEQNAGAFRVEAYRRAAETIRSLPTPVADIFSQEGLDGLEALPTVGVSIARAIRDVLVHGRAHHLERLRGAYDPIAVLCTVPSIGPSLAKRLHDELGIATLTALEAAAHDGRLESLPGLGPRRLAVIRDQLARRHGRSRAPKPAGTPPHEPSVEELLDVDRQYREGAGAGVLKRIAPLRFNPHRKAWLPVLHTTRGDRHYFALFSNTARAHALKATHDWVVLFHEGPEGEGQSTVITAQFGRLRGQRIVRGREAECARWYYPTPAGIPDHIPLTASAPPA